MALLKCPGCKNTIAAETLTCPICGCNPRTCRLRKYLFWTAASAATLLLVASQLRHHVPVSSGPPTQAVAGTGR